MTRPLWQSMWRGFNLRCPHCGHQHLLSGYLKVAPRCRNCGEDFSHHQADDAPPYFTILIVAHLVVPAMVIVEKLWSPPIGIQMAVWLPLIAGLCLWLLPKVKGAVVGLQWALHLHGFGERKDVRSKP